MSGRIILVGLVIFLSGCNESENSSIKSSKQSMQLSGGINVGNPTEPRLKTYFSTDYHFAVRYAEGLSLKIVSSDEFSISNAENAKDVSEVRFKVLKDLNGADIKSVEGLLAALNEQFPQDKYQPISFRGASGFYSTSRQGTNLESNYYILNSNSILIHAHIHAVESDRGIDLIAPIVNTFAYDIEAPKILELKMEPNVIRAGDTARLLVHATDDVSGIYLWGTVGGIPVGAPLPGSVEDTSNASIQPLGNDWYEFKFPVNRFAAPGDYSLNEFWLIDNAINVTILRRTSFNDFYYGDSQTDLPVLKYTVINDGTVVTEGPSVKMVRIEPESLVAGEPAKLFFQVEASAAGVSSEVRSCPKFQLNGPLYVPIYYTDPGSARIGCNRKVRSEGDNWYSIDLELNKYMPSGKYSLSRLEVSNDADRSTTLFACDDPSSPSTWKCQSPGQYFYFENGRLSSLPVLVANVENSGSIDTTAPVVYEMKLENTEVKAGGMGRLLFKAIDDVSGLNMEAAYAEIRSLESHHSALIGWSDRMISLGDQWYSMQFYIGPYVPSGEYFSNLHLSDLANNRRELMAYSHLIQSGQQSIYTTNQDIKIPILKFKVMR